MRVLTVEEMRRLEGAADGAGHSYAEMMERAGRGLAEAIVAQAPRVVEGQRVLVLVGPGNNGGDGLVAARYLAEVGAEVQCYLLKPRSDDDANLKAVRDRDLFVAIATNDQRWRVLQQLVANADVIVDALLGTGVRLPLKGTVVDLLRQVKAGLKGRRTPQAATRSLVAPDRPAHTRTSSPLCVAVDGPSGLDYDTGALDPGALAADVTVTFACPKQGHFQFPGAEACGDLIVADIGVHPTLVREVLGEPGLEVATAETVAALLPHRPLNAHKGTFGRALIVAGSINYTGAACLAASAATRVGTGLVTLAVPSAIHSALAAKISEATFLILPQVMGIVAAGAVGLLIAQMGSYQAMLLGPGLTQEKEAVEFVHKLFEDEVHATHTGRIGFQTGRAPTRKESEQAEMTFPPLVIDADGLNALAQLGTEEWPRRLPKPAVLTPHPGEMARLMAAETATVQADRVGIASRMAQNWGHVVLLKGAYSVVANPAGRVVLVPFATPALASAGSGDVLAGAIVGLLAQGMAPFDAAVAGAYLHGLAGRWAGEQIGVAGVVAGDLLSRLPQALRVVAQQ